MVNAVLITTDNKLAIQIKEWVKVLPDFGLKTYDDLPVFVKSLGLAEDDIKHDIDHTDLPKTDGAPSDAAKAKVSDEAAAKAVSDAAIRLLIVDLEILMEAKVKPLAWIAQIKMMLEENHHSDPNFPTRILLLGFDDAINRPDKLRHPSVNDLMLKPIEKTLFLQKVELLIMEKLGTKPTFLFRQETAVPIEVGKDAMIDEVSDFAIAIRNPTPLADGVFAAIHSDIFGEGRSRVTGRSYRSERHSTHQGEFLIRFSLFGVSTLQLGNLRRYIKKRRVPGVRLRPNILALANATASRDANLPEPFLKKVAVIDMDRDVQSEIKGIFEEKFANISVSSFPSYTKFLSKFAAFAEKAPTAQAPVIDAITESPDGTLNIKPAATPGGRPLAMTIRLPDAEIAGFDSEFESEERFVGRASAELLAQPQAWKEIIHKDDRESFDEFIAYLMTGAGRGQLFLRIEDPEKRIYFVGVNASALKTDTGRALRLEWLEVDEEKWREETGGADSTDLEALRFDAIFVDPKALRVPVDEWVESLKAILIKVGLMGVGVEGLPKIFVMTDEESAVAPDSCRIKGICDFFYKPIDRKMLINKICAIMPDFEVTDDASISNFIATEVPVRLAKNVMMEEVSEFGLSIGHRTPFKAGVFMRFFNPIFGTQEAGILGRCTHCDKTGGGPGAAAGAGGEKKKDGYRCHFTFFGTNEETLKRIRTWIREDYVQKKGTGG